MANPLVNIQVTITVEDTPTGQTTRKVVSSAGFQITNDQATFSKDDSPARFTIAPSTIFPIDMTKLGGTAKLIYLEVDNLASVLLSGSVTPQPVSSFILIKGNVTSISIVTPSGPTVNCKMLMLG